MADSGARLNVNVAIYLDENYAVPATVMVRSLLDNATAGDRIQLFILAIGLTDKVKRTMEASWPRERLDLRWIDLDLTLHEGIDATAQGWVRVDRQMAGVAVPS